MSLTRIGLLPRLLMTATCLTPLAPLTFAQTTVVTLTDGRELEGELVEQTDRRLVLRISGIDTPLERRQIASVQERPSVEQEYQRRKAALEPQDLAGRHELAGWLLSQGALDLAEREARELEQLAPESERVQALIAAIQARRELGIQGQAAARQRPGRPTPAGERPGEAVQEDGLRLLNDREIALIRVWELPEDLASAQVRLRIPRDVIEQAISEFGHTSAVPQTDTERRRLMRAGPADQMAFLFQLGAADPQARQLYERVEVAGDPAAMVEFRRNVYGNYIQRYFRRHFGGGQVPGFALVGPNPNTAAEVYTNFFILSQTLIDGHPMIDRFSPIESLLLQWGLPRDQALQPAPNVPGWRPYFTGTSDPQFERIHAWINSLYSGEMIDYGIEYSGLRMDSPLMDEQDQTPPQPQLSDEPGQ